MTSAARRIAAAAAVAAIVPLAPAVRREFEDGFIRPEGAALIAVDDVEPGRAVKPGRIKRALGRGKIEEAARDKIRELYERLSDGD